MLWLLAGSSVCVVLSACDCSKF